MSTSNDLEQFAVHAESQPVQPATEVGIDREIRVAFLAHILTGVPFIQQYQIANLGFVEFATVSAAELDRLRYLAVRSSSPQEKGARLRRLLAVACVNRLEIDGRAIPPVQDRLWASAQAYEVFLSLVPVGLLQVIESYYLEFSGVMSRLVDKVSDRSFWPTP